MARTTLRLFSLFTLLLTAAGVSHATIIAQYDALADTGSYIKWVFHPGYEVLAQSFVPTADGTVVSVDTYLQKYYTSSTTVPIQFQITTALGGQPDFTNVLSTGTLSASHPLLNDMFINWVDTTMTPATLYAGTTYMLVATAAGTDGDYEWYSKMGGTGYASGSLLRGPVGSSSLHQEYDDDLAFRIHAADAAPPEVPEPATLGGLAIGLLALGALKRRVS